MFVSKPFSGRVFIAQRSRRGYRKLLWSALVLASDDNDVVIDVSDVPKPIRQQAYKLFWRRQKMKEKISDQTERKRAIEQSR